MKWYTSVIDSVLVLLNYNQVPTWVKFLYIGTGACFSKVPIINGPGKLSPFTLKIEVSIVLLLIRVVREMGISPQIARIPTQLKNDKNLTETQKVQDFNSNKKQSKFPDYAKSFKKEYIFFIRYWSIIFAFK